MFSNSILISWRVRAVHLFRKVIFVKIEFVEYASALFDYLCYIKKKRVRQSFRLFSSFFTNAWMYSQR